MTTTSLPAITYRDLNVLASMIRDHDVSPGHPVNPYTGCKVYGTFSDVRAEWDVLDRIVEKWVARGDLQRIGTGSIYVNTNTEDPEIIQRRQRLRLEYKIELATRARKRQTAA